MKSVFLIKSPLQLLNAIEAKYHFKLKTENCVLIVMGDRKSQPQILKLAGHMNEWGALTVLNESPLFIGNPFENKSIFSSNICGMGALRKSFFNVRRLNRIRKYLGEVEYIFVGYPRYIYMRHFINVMPHKKVIVLDDGNATIRLAKERSGAMLSSPDIGWLKKLKILAKRIFQGVKDAEKEALGFFTIYNIEAGVNDSVVKNNFDYLRSRLELLEETGSIYFVGSPLSEVGLLGQDEYLGYLKKVQEYFKGKPLVYIVHRRESQQKIAMIEQSLGLEAVLYDYPLEYQLAVVGPRPAVLASFFSSALDSCSLIFKNKLPIVAFKINITDASRKNEIASIYSNYEADENIEVIDKFSI